MSQTSTARNLLISFGAFWLSLMTVVPMDLLFGKLTTRIIYGDGVVDAILMGSLESLGRAFSAILGGTLALIFAEGSKKVRWAFIVPILYVIDAPIRYSRWYSPPTIWERLWQGANLVFPAIACAICIGVVDHLRRTRSEPERTKSSFQILLVASFAVAITAASIAHLSDGNSVLAMLRLTVPLWIAWGLLIFVGFWRFKSRGFWLLLGAPLTFFWALVVAMRFLTG